MQGFLPGLFRQGSLSSHIMRVPEMLKNFFTIRKLHLTFLFDFHPALPPFIFLFFRCFFSSLHFSFCLFSCKRANFPQPCHNLTHGINCSFRIFHAVVASESEANRTMSSFMVPPSYPPLITWLASRERLKQAEPVLTANPLMSICRVMDSPST